MNVPIDMIGGFIADEQQHAREYPSPAVAGSVNVTPVIGGDGIVRMQMNGWAVVLYPDGIWEIDDTAADAKNQKEEVTNEPESNGSKNP